MPRAPAPCAASPISTRTNAPTALATVESHLDAIRGAGRATRRTRRTSDEARLIGRSLELATRRPSDDFVYVVDGQPVIAAWGYEADAAASLQAFAPPPVPMSHRAPAADIRQRAASLLPARIGWAPWVSALLFGLLLLLLLLHDVVAAARLRAGRSVAERRHAWRRPRRPRPKPPPDPTPVLKASLDDAQADEKKLKAELAALQADLKDKVEQCKPIEPPKPPPPPPPPAKATAAATAAAAAPARRSRRRAAAPPVNRPPPGHAAVRLVGRFRRRGRDPQQTLSGRQAWIRRASTTTCM